jgi:regulatory protein
VPSRGEENPSPRPRIEFVRKRASGAATIAVGGSSFYVALDLVEELGLAASSLAAGAELDEASVRILTLAAEAGEAAKRGMALLARAEQSTFMLRAKLVHRGFSSRAIEIALSRLKAEGLLDDRRFASAYAASRLSRVGSKAEGPLSLAAALRGRGIDRLTAAEAVAGLLGPEERRSALARAAEKETKRVAGNKEELRQRLRALGFKSEEISEYFERHED